MNTLQVIAYGLRNYKAWWRTVVVLLFACAVYTWLVEDVASLKAQAGAVGSSPSMALLIEASGNFMARLGCLILIVGASVVASRWTWLPVIVNLCLTYWASIFATNVHAVAAGCLAVVCGALFLMHGVDDSAAHAGQHS